MSKNKQLNNDDGISVIVATLGTRNELLKLTLESIVSQKIDNLNIIMVYPLENQETKALASEYNAYSIGDPGSMAGAVNVGIRHSTQKYVSWIGDDDLLLPNSLQHTSKALDTHPEGVAAFGYCNYINEHGKLLFTSKAGKLAPWIMTWGPDLVPLPGALFRRSSLEQLDYLFDESLNFALDLDIFLRLRKIGKLVNVAKPVSAFRWHSTSATVSSRDKSLDEAELVKRKHLPSYLRPISTLWDKPVRIATKIAAKRVAKLAAK